MDDDDGMGMGTRTRMLGLLSLRFLRWGHADGGHGAHTDRSNGDIFELGNVEEGRREKRGERSWNGC